MNYGKSSDIINSASLEPRVLKPGGKIWIQVPWLYPYHAVPKDYWRISPDGLRIWMENFKEINCGIELWDKTSLIISSYYLGEKK